MKFSYIFWKIWEEFHNQRLTHDIFSFFRCVLDKVIHYWPDEIFPTQSEYALDIYTKYLIASVIL